MIYKRVNYYVGTEYRQGLLTRDNLNDEIVKTV